MSFEVNIPSLCVCTPKTPSIFCIRRKPPKNLSLWFFFYNEFSSFQKNRIHRPVIFLVRPRREICGHRFSGFSLPKQFLPLVFVLCVLFIPPQNGISVMRGGTETRGCFFV